MKYRLAASVSPLFTVGEWRRNICNSILLASKFTYFSGICPSAARFRYQGFESLGTAVHTSSCEDDFSELGPPVGQNVAKQLKLVTEKPEPQKANPAAQATVSRPSSSANRRRPSSSANRRSARDVQDFNKFSQTSKMKLQNHKQNALSKVEGTMTIDHDESLKLDSSCSISIENVPSTVGISDLVQAMSVFGKVSRACIRSVPDGLDCCDVEFENSESGRRAVLAGAITLESIDLPIRPLLSSEIVIIRIEGIGKETTDLSVHFMCKLIGPLEGLEMDGKDAVNAFFRVKNDAELQRIVKRLNNIIIDGCYWSAYQLPSNSTSVATVKKDAKSTLGLRLNNRLDELKRQLDLKMLYRDDLKLLHMGILHLQGLPTCKDPCSED